ncbi:uncharacterized protein LOC133468375 isoform X1 [Phyllopteryx taeniolatus]|uniref:uncharacterized protein LOC133468375 isoform X1 n=1 Tax=Phyllopteryx taeniolatus TaxID=161469 RepID=UPI002AD585EB|nr:uncharacterized protein LOC133468375 isoform X1 [Phyllopteryx taeniolatus]
MEGQKEEHQSCSECVDCYRSMGPLIPFIEAIGELFTALQKHKNRKGRMPDGLLSAVCPGVLCVDFGQDKNKFVFGDITRLTYTRGGLQSTKEATPDFLSPTFANLLSFFPPELLTGAATAVFSVWRRRRRHRGKRAGIQVKLRNTGYRLAFQSIHLANERSLPNKMDELHLLMKSSKDFGRSAAMFFTETLLCEAIPDGAVMLPGFHLHLADRIMELTGKT